MAVRKPPPHQASWNRVCWWSWSVEGKELIKRKKLRDWRRINAGRGTENCQILAVRVSALSNPDMDKLWPHPEVLMLLRGLQGIRSAVGRKSAKRSHAVAENKMILWHFPYQTLVFCWELISGFGIFLNALEKVKTLSLPSNPSDP